MFTDEKYEDQDKELNDPSQMMKPDVVRVIKNNDRSTVLLKEDNPNVSRVDSLLDIDSKEDIENEEVVGPEENFSREDNICHGLGGTV